MRPDLNENIQKRFTKRFYKENGLWFIDLPEFLNAGLGTKANLLMVDGSDKMLDILSRNSGEVVVQFSDCGVDHLDARMQMRHDGMNPLILAETHHAPITHGRYYETTAHFADAQTQTLMTWLCPVAEWVFGGYYPKTIGFEVVSHGVTTTTTTERRTFLQRLGF
jgi:hypothetical protein